MVPTQISDVNIENMISNLVCSLWNRNGCDLFIVLVREDLGLNQESVLVESLCLVRCSTLQETAAMRQQKREDQMISQAFRELTNDVSS